ncbi:MAG: hypothetical protein RSD28_02410 [Lachnospiraceae bacterium]
MQIKDKLEVFYQSTVQVAKTERRALMEDYETAGRENLEVFRKNKQEEMDNLFQIEETRIKREVNRRISQEITRQKHALDDCQQDKKQTLFQRVEELLEAYKKTEEYTYYLIEKINKAKELANGEELIIYLNREDCSKKELLEEKTQTVLTVSEVEFGGGIRAVIRSKNILMDESFVTKIKEERNAYTF